MLGDIDSRIAEVAVQGLRELGYSEHFSILRTSVTDDGKTRRFRLRNDVTGVELSVCVEWSATDLSANVDRFKEQLRLKSSFSVV